MKYINCFIFCALPIYIIAQKIDTSNLYTIDSLNKITNSYIDQGNLDKAIEINSEAQKLVSAKLGAESSAYADICFNFGRIYMNQYNFSEAEKWLLINKNIVQKIFGKESKDYAKITKNLGSLYLDEGNFQKAEIEMLETVSTIEKLKGRSNAEYCGALINLGICYKNSGKYELSEKCYNDAKEIFETILNDKSHPFYANCLRGLGQLYLTLGKYEEAEEFYLSAKKILEVKGIDPGVRIDLGVLYSTMGNYEKAEPIFLDMSIFFEKTFGKEDPRYALSLNNLGLVYTSLGNYSEAEKIYLQAILILEKSLGKESPEYILCAINIGNVYFSLKNYKKAEEYYAQVKALYIKVEDTAGEKYAGVLINLGSVYLETRQFELAEPLFLEAKEIFEVKLKNLNHPYYINCLTNLSECYLNRGDFSKAKSLKLEAKKTLENTLGKETPEYTSILRSLANFYESQQNYFETEKMLEEYYFLTKSILSKSIGFLSERELASYISNLYNDVDFLSSSILNRNSKSEKAGVLASINYDLLLFQKGFLLSAAKQFNAPLNNTPELMALNNQLKSCRRRLANEYAKPIAEQENVSELEQKANTAEKDIARSISGYTDSKRQVKWQDVKTILKSDEAAIEFVHFNCNFPRPNDSLIYAALIIKPTLPQPVFIPLLEEKSLDSIMQSKGERRLEYVNDLYTFSSRGVSPIQDKKRSLSELIFKPLEKELAGIKTIYYSPSGLLHRINLDAIPVSETETLADRYNLVEMNSTRQLVIPTVVKNSTHDAVLFGGIKFDVDSTLLTKEPLFASRTESQLSFSQTNPQSRGSSWDYLPGTEREVNAIEKIMTSGGIKTTLKKDMMVLKKHLKVLD